MRVDANNTAVCHENTQCKRRVCWSAIIAGALVAIGLGFLLNTFCVGIGLSLVNMSEQGMATLAIGGFIALLVGSFVIMFLAGSTAGHLASDSCSSKKFGAFYGFVTWCLALLISMGMTIHAGHSMPDYRHFMAASQHVNVDQRNVQVMNTNNNAQANVNSEEAVNSVGHASFVLFILFFVGALACTWGGCYGVCCRDKCHSANKV